MKIVVARTAGFCGGVKRAVKIASEGNSGARLVLGSLVHNKKVIETLKNQGISFSDTPIEGYDDYVVSAHGIPFSMYSDLQSKKVLDATCPKVERLFNVCANAKGTVLLVGDGNHEEVKNAISYAKSRVEILSPTAVDIDKLVELAKEKEDRYTLVFQTTLSPEIAGDYINTAIRLFLDRVEIIVTLCPSVNARIDEGKSIAREADKMIVLGDRTSANCNTLYRECLKINPNTIFIENAQELPVLTDKCVGVTAGASVPMEIIDEVVEKLNLM